MVSAVNQGYNIDEAINNLVKLARVLADYGYVRYARFIVQCVPVLDDFIEDGEEDRVREWLIGCCKKVWDRIVPEEDYDIITVGKVKETKQDHELKQAIMGIYAKIEKNLNCDLSNVKDDRKLDTKKYGDPNKRWGEENGKR